MAIYPELHCKISFILQGNHKSAIKYESECAKIVISEVTPLEYKNNLQHGVLAPVGIDDKFLTELQDGSKKVKYRLTHDQSFEASLGYSVNV
jgi:hypothetical protein